MHKQSVGAAACFPWLFDEAAFEKLEKAGGIKLDAASRLQLNVEIPKICARKTLKFKDRDQLAKKYMRLVRQIDGALGMLHALEAPEKPSGQPLDALCRWAEQEARKLKDTPIDPRDSILVIVAFVFKRAGGVASASYQQAKGCLDSPFLRFLRAINKRLPSRCRVSDDRARHTISLLKEAQGKNHSNA